MEQRATISRMECGNVRRLPDDWDAGLTETCARILIEGRPGSGKTMAVARLVELLRAEGVAVSGFFTREVREGGERVGFALETLDGERGLLAHVRVRGGLRVGRYGVVL